MVGTSLYVRVCLHLLHAYRIGYVCCLCVCEDTWMSRHICEPFLPPTGNTLVSPTRRTWVYRIVPWFGHLEMHKDCLAIQAQARTCLSRHVSGWIDDVIGHRSPKDGFRSGDFSQKDLNLGSAARAGCNLKCVGEILRNDSHKDLTEFQSEFEVVFVSYDFRIHVRIWRRNCAKEKHVF